MYFVCRLTANSSVPLYVVRAPSEIERGDCIASYRSTGEVPPEELGDMAETDEPVSMTMRKYYAGVWDDLVRENAPLRPSSTALSWESPPSFTISPCAQIYPKGNSMSRA
jgi:hypothetical protein